MILIGLIAVIAISISAVPTALAAPSLDVDCEKNPDNPNCQEHKILICHLPPGNPDNGQEIWIDESAWNTPGANDHGPGRHGGDYLITSDSPPCGKDDEKPTYVTICWNDETLSVLEEDLDQYPGYGEDSCKATPPKHKGKSNTSCKVGCGPHIDEEAVYNSSRVGINFYPSYDIYGGNKSHLWSFQGTFEIKNLSTGEMISAVERPTPNGTVWVIDIDTTAFRVFVDGEQLLRSCKNIPCSTSGWSYVDGTNLLPYGPYNQSELAEWFFADPLFNIDDWTEAKDWAKQVAESFKDDMPFDLTPILAQ